MAEEAAIALTMLTICFLIGWVVWVVSNGRRRSQEIQSMADFHNRLLDKIGSTKDFGDFLATEAGQNFLNSVKAEPVNRGSRILRALQVGVILAMAGLAFLALGALYPYEEAFMVLGVLVLACGLGFLFSAGITYTLGGTLGG